MPILDVEVVLAPEEALPPGLAAALADHAAAVFRSGPGETWVKLRPLAASGYAENGGGPDSGVRPVFVSVLRARWPDPERRAVELRQLTEAVARACSRPAEHVHVSYAQEGAGRAAFGGHLV